MPKQQEAPYQLAFDPVFQRVCATGPTNIMRQLRAVPEGFYLRTNDPPYMSFPTEKTTFLMLEAIAAADFVSEGYKEARARCLKPTEDQVSWIREKLIERGVNPDTLLEHQIEWLVAYIVALQSGFSGMMNASEQGTGKTRMALACLLLTGATRCLVVCPNSVIPEWQKENERWLGEDSPITIWGMDSVPIKIRNRAFEILRDRPGINVGVINYESVIRLGGGISVFEPDMLILDESWWLKNEGAKKSQFLDIISDYIRYVIPMGGTPIGNDVGDLFSQIRLIDKGIFPAKKKDFMERFSQRQDVYARGIPIAKKAIGVLDPAGLIGLISPIWFRATKATCLQLPPKVYERIYLDLDVDSQTLYNQVEEEGEQALGNDYSLSGTFVIMMRLQQITGGFAPIWIANEENELLGETIQVPFNSSVKLEWLKEWVIEHILADPSIRFCVWCRFNSEVFKIAEELNKILGEEAVVPITGKVKNEELSKVKEEYNSRSGNIRGLINQIDKMCSGHNLQSTDYNICYSPTWSYIKRSQLEDRSHRMGREGAVTYLDLICRGTIDVDVMAAVDRKEDIAMRLTPHTISTAVIDTVEENINEIEHSAG